MLIPQWRKAPTIILPAPGYSFNIEQIMMKHKTVMSLVIRRSKLHRREESYRIIAIVQQVLIWVCSKSSLLFVYNMMNLNIELKLITELKSLLVVRET